MDLYTKRGVVYAPTWKNPRTGRVIPAHSLGTTDYAEADARWTLEKARDLQRFPAPNAHGTQAELPGVVDGLRLSDVFARYLVHKRAGIKPATFAAYQQYADLILRRLEDWNLDALVPPHGTSIIGGWATKEIIRLNGTHTVHKWLETMVKPALRYAHAQGWLTRLPTFPDVDSDYDPSARSHLVLSLDEFVAMRRALPELDAYNFVDGRSLVVYPRLWFEIAVATGLHASDVDRFKGRYWRKLGHQWWRENSKGIKHHPPTWLPCGPMLQDVLERASTGRDVGAETLWVAEAAPPVQWMRPRLERAAKTAGVPVAPQPIDLRHTCAVWKRDAGWEFDETAKWLGNTSGIVERVYAQLPPRRMTELVERTAPAEHARLAAMHAPPRLSLAKAPGGSGSQPKKERDR